MLAEAKTKIEIQHFQIGDLRPDPFNPRRMSDAELDSLTRSIQESGLIDPIITAWNRCVRALES